MATHLPRLIVAGLSGDSGKTTVSLSLLSALRQRGLSVSVFKKGPDYIDAAWLTSVAGTPCRNLDTYMAGDEAVYRSFATRAAVSHIALVEGNRGLFDGQDARGTHSTAALARLLQAPVVLTVDVTKSTRTVAALVNGCLAFEPDLRIAAVVLNKVAGARHEKVIRDALAAAGSPPVLGAVPRREADAGLIPGRHLGLVTPAEFGAESALRQHLRSLGESYLDVDGLLAVAASAVPLDVPEVPSPEPLPASVRIGYFDDSVFTFYYPENLEALTACGAELVPVSSLSDTSLPNLDALYIGGGFPETHAQQLAAHTDLMRSVRDAACAGLPVFAECGGLIYLSRSLTWRGQRYPMAGVFPYDVALQPRPVGHGYTRVDVDRPNPFFAVGTSIRGHEFHYSELVSEVRPGDTCMGVSRGIGVGNGRDGLVFNNTLACYTHIHADAVRGWAAALVASAQAYMKSRGAGSRPNDNGGTTRMWPAVGAWAVAR